MRKLILRSGQYAFDASAGTITLSSELDGIELQDFLLITNVVDNEILYNFAKAELNATLSGRVLTLDADTSAMSDTDPLQIVVYVPDGRQSVDAFGRVRTADTGQRLDVEFIYDKQVEFFDEVTTGAGTVTHNANTRDLTLAVGSATNGDEAAMYSHPVPYTPGNSQLVEMTGVLNAGALAVDNVTLFKRTSISGSMSETLYAQTGWDAFTDTGMGQLPWQNSFIFGMDFQSLKVGLIRFFLNVGGENVIIKTVPNDFIRDSGYWQLPSLPVYYRIYNTAANTIMEMGYGDESNAIGIRFTAMLDAGAEMRAICCTVKSEGGKHLSDLDGLPRTVNNGLSGKSVASAQKVPLVSLRTRALFQSVPNMGLIVPKGISIATDQDIRVEIIVNGVLSGAVWGNVDVTNSIAEYDTTASLVAPGIVIASFYLRASGAIRPADLQRVLSKTVLWERLMANPVGFFTISAQALSTTATVNCAVDWIEIR